MKKKESSNLKYIDGDVPDYFDDELKIIAWINDEWVGMTSVVENYVLNKMKK